MSKKIWASISVIGIVFAVVWAYQSSQAQEERVATATHVRKMLGELESIDYAANLYKDLKKNQLLSDSPLSTRVYDELNEMFKVKKIAIGTEKDDLLTDVGKEKHKWTYSREELLRHDIEHWVRDNDLNRYQKLDVTVSYFSEKYADANIERYVAEKGNFTDFYKLRDYLKEVKKAVTKKGMDLFDFVNIYVPMIISILSIIAWIYGVIQPQRLTRP